MKINIRELQYKDAIKLDKKRCKLSIENKLVGDGFQLISTDEDGDLGGVLTLSTNYEIAVIMVNDAYYCVSLVDAESQVIVVKSGEIN